ncbi:MAG: anthranilate phosphoribosyltransferase [Thermodesulfobacteriota bacterium]|nr:anthranilate phosphoribosyltransferase [Thermodesulfobacteriota bacterium]
MAAGIDDSIHRRFGDTISRLIRRENLTRSEAEQAFTLVLNDGTTPVQQGAFLAALAAKGETADEIAGAWEAIYYQDTVHVPLDPSLPVVENSGTGMDTFKTFNISTAAAIVAASRGIPMARHGARAITSACGTVDMAERLGVDVACPPDRVAASIATAGIGLFNGMSPTVHPGALGRILSRIHFGSTLNIAASLANPALPKIGLRGVYSKEMVMPVIRVMKAIGYQKAIVLHGAVHHAHNQPDHDPALSMDEASVCGPTVCARLTDDGSIERFTLRPEAYGLGSGNPSALCPAADMATETRRFVDLISGRDSGLRKEAVLLNAALIFYVAETVPDIDTGLETAARALESGDALNTLSAWVTAQNNDPEKGQKTLEQWIN